jgi:hypothetical protein
MNKLDHFDTQLQGLVNADRMKDYGHPADHFAKSAALKAELFKDYTGDASVRHAMEMIVDKLVRLSHSPFHLDSWIDVAGYARTAVMVIDRNEAMLLNPDLKTRNGAWSPIVSGVTNLAFDYVDPYDIGGDKG